MPRRNPTRTPSQPFELHRLTLDDLRPAPYNPRQMTPSARQALQQSLSEFGDIAGITFNTRTGRLVTGHQRLEALRVAYGSDLQLSTDGNSPDTALLTSPAGDVYKVRLVDWDDATEKAANVAANSPYLSANFDDEQLHSLLMELETQAPGMMQDLRLDELLADVAPPPEVVVEEGASEFTREGQASVTYSGPEARINEIKRLVSEKRNALAEATGRAPRDVPATEALHKLLTDVATPAPARRTRRS